MGCIHSPRSPRSHSYLCSWGFAPLPSRSILKSIGYRYICLLVIGVYKISNEVEVFLLTVKPPLTAERLSIALSLTANVLLI
ncbi:hypothetical protein EAE89_01220 [Photorhabdus heterorhabditis]|nr:hypothetical protein [Photorhabdus heterorhabditis]